MEQSHPQLYDHLLLHQNKVERASGALQRDVKLESSKQPVAENEWKSDDCNTYSERSSYNKREDELLLKSIKEEVKLEPVITEEIDLKDEVISETPSESITILENKPADYVSPIQNTDLYTEDVLKALKPNVKLELAKSIREEIEVFSATTTVVNERSSTSYYNYDTCTENSSQNIKEDELVLESVGDNIKLDPVITEEIDLKDDIISETLSESISEKSASSNDDDCNACIERSLQYNEDNVTIESIKAATNKTANNSGKSNMVQPKQKPKKILHCTKCAFETLSRSTLRNHKIAKHTEISYSCYECPFKTKYKQHLKVHVGTHAGDKGKHLQCNLCDFNAAWKTILRKHKLSVHGTERRFECKLCPYRAKMLDGLKRHVDQTHNKGDCFKCDVCDYKTEFKYNLTEHAKSHTGEKFLKCSECEYRGKTKRSMKKHMVKHSTHKSFECYECGHKTKSKNSLIIHVQKHRTDRCHKCTVCGYSTNIKYSLDCHLKKKGHTSDSKDKMFICNVCDYTTSSDKILKWHVKVHTGEKIFECHLCEYKTDSSSNFRKHEYIHERRNKS